MQNVQQDCNSCDRVIYKKQSELQRPNYNVRTAISIFDNPNAKKKMQGGGDVLLLNQHCVFDILDSEKRTCKASGKRNPTERRWT